MTAATLFRRPAVLIGGALAIGLVIGSSAPRAAAVPEPGHAGDLALVDVTPDFVAAADQGQDQGRGGRGRGTPPPPPEPPPDVMPPPVEPIVSMTPPDPDPRVGLAAGQWDAGQAAWNMALISTTPPTPEYLGFTHSDLAFKGNYVVQGNYNGFEIFDISNPREPVRVAAVVCPASQNDVSVYGNLLFVSAEGQASRLDCGPEGVPDPISAERIRGIRIFDISDITNPRYVSNVQTCRGSHTHTVLTDPNDPDNVYVYISGSSRVRSEEELPGCLDSPDPDDPESARFRLEVIQIPVDAPEEAAIVSSPRVFHNLEPAPRNAERDAMSRRGGAGRGGARGGGEGRGEAAGPGRGGRAQGPRTGPNQCHDITAYPEIGLAGGACGGYGLLLDIREVAHPIRIEAAADSNMSFWHSATFSNDGTKVLFTDEWGGGSAPRCRDTDRYEWGANAIFTIEGNELVFHSYYKMPAVQTSNENCVAHNGSLIPIPGREVMVQGWYQGGLSIFDWTDVANPMEIAFFDRGPMSDERLISAGPWSVYWYNGVIVSSEIFRGLDIFELLPSGLISQNEIDAAKTVRWGYLNAQEQRRIVWPPSFALARAYLDQLERSAGLSAEGLASARAALNDAEGRSGAGRRAALEALAGRLTDAVATSSDAGKVRVLATAVADLAGAQ